MSIQVHATKMNSVPILVGNAPSTMADEHLPTTKIILLLLPTRTTVGMDYECQREYVIPNHKFVVKSISRFVVVMDKAMKMCVMHTVWV